jgi:hypothetical protein
MTKGRTTTPITAIDAEPSVARHIAKDAELRRMLTDVLAQCSKAAEGRSAALMATATALLEDESAPAVVETAETLREREAVLREALRMNAATLERERQRLMPEAVAKVLPVYRASLRDLKSALETAAEKQAALRALLGELHTAGISAPELRAMPFQVYGTRGPADPFADDLSIWLAEVAEHGLLG